MKSVVVSNFKVQHVEALRMHGRPLPVAHQIEMHPLIYKGRIPLLDY